MFQYVALSIILIILLFNVYLRITHPFWCIQPAFHIYDLHLWAFPNRVINENLPVINKYVKLFDTETYNVKNAPIDVVRKACALVRSNFLNTKLVSYSPSDEDILTYLKTIIYPSFITVYSIPKILNCKKETIIDRDIIGVITARPMYLCFNDGASYSLCVNYVDNLCIRKDSRKQGFGQILIQSLHYAVRHVNKDIVVSLFKREGEMTAIIPLTSYVTTGYDIIDIPRLRPGLPSLNIIRINQQTFNLISGFLKNIANDFECVLHPEKILMLRLISCGLLQIYTMIENNDIIAAYFFKKTNSLINGSKGIECIATIDKTTDDNIFFGGFCTAVRRVSRRFDAQFLWLEQTSDAYKLANALDRHGVRIRTSCPNAFFLYNYAKYSNRPEKCLMIY